MKYIFDWVVEVLNSGNILSILVFVFVCLAFNYKKIIDFIDDRKKVRISNITDALDCKFITGLTRELLEEELATERFKMATGMPIERQFREAIIVIHKNAKGDVSFSHFKRALPHIVFKGGRIKIEISKLDRFSCWFNTFFGFAAAFLSFIFMVLPSQVNGITLVQYLIFFGFGIFLIMVCFFMLSQTFPIISAKKIKKIMSENETSDS